MKKGRIIFLLLFVVAVISAAVYTLQFLYAKDQAPEARYAVEAPAMGDIMKKTVSSGSIVPRKEILIKPQISGIVSKVLIEAGEIVERGDLLAVVRVVPDMGQLSSAQSRLERARINQDDAQRSYNRQSMLKQNGVISAQDFEQAETFQRQAQEEFRAAEDNLQIVRDGVADRSGEASNTEVRSTVEGMVLDVPVEVGNTVIQANTFNDGTTIAIVADMQDLIFKGNIDESEVENLHEGIALILTLGAMPGRTFNAALEFISPKGVEDNGAIQFEIRAAVALDPSDFIRAGFSANADVVLDERLDVLTLAESLVQYEGAQAYVEVQTSPQQFERRDVDLGLSDGLTVEVLSGVALGDSVKQWNQPKFD